MNSKTLGIDIGSTTVKIAILDESHQILFADYERHFANIQETLASLLAKAIDGVYDSDPKTNPDAKRYDEVSIQEVIDKQLAVVDLTASILSMENKMPMYVFGLNEENSIVKAISGDFNGTKVTV